MAHILVVDDRAANRQFLVSLLTYVGHRISEVSDGKAALDIIAHTQPDLVITDVLMPVMDGFELVRILRADEKTAGLPVVFYTSTYRAPEAQVLADAGGANLVLRKPCEPEVMLKAVADILGAPHPRGAPKAANDGAPEQSFSDLSTPRDPRDLQQLNARLTAILEASLEAQPQEGPQHVADLFFDLARRMLAIQSGAFVLENKAGAEPFIVCVKGLSVDVARAAGATGLLSQIVEERRSARIVDRVVIDRLCPGGDAKYVQVTAVQARGQVCGWFYFAGDDADEVADHNARMAQMLSSEFAVFYEAAETHEMLQRHAARLQVESAAREKAENEVRRRYREQATLAEFSLAALNVEDFEEKIAEAPAFVCAALNVECCVIADVSKRQDRMQILSAHGLQGDATLRVSLSEISSAALIHKAVRHPGVHYTDVEVDGGLSFEASPVLGGRGLQSGIVQSSAYGDDGVVLVYAFSREIRGFADSDVNIVRTIGNVMAVFKDRERAVSRLRLRERALDAISQGIFISDESLPIPQIIYSNPAFRRMTGFSSEELLGRAAHTMLANENDEVLNAQLALARAKRRPIRFETKFKKRDGSAFMNRVLASPIVGSDGLLAYSVVVNDDITSERQREEQLHEAQKMEAVGQLTGGIAHDFNNLLTVIKANAEDLLEDLKDNEIQGRQAEMLLLAANRGADLVQQLMAFARKQELEPKAVDANALIQSFAKLLKRTLPENIRIHFLGGLDVPHVLVDPGRLENALLNLCLNARDAMPDGGTINIETQIVTLDSSYVAERPDVRAGQYVMIAVTDEGEGMSKEVIEKAFQPFFTTKEVGRGTGLGLSMVYGFVKQSGGHARIYSEIGFGTTIKLYLPPGEESNILDGEQQEAAEAYEVHECRILLVEDDELVRRSVMGKLERLGYFVTVAASARQALDILETDANFDLVFTDVIMPGTMNGADLARAVVERWPGMRILMTSGYTEASALGKIDMPRGIKLLSKPYANVDLVRTLQEVLAAPPPRTVG